MRIEIIVVLFALILLVSVGLALWDRHRRRKSWDPALDGSKTLSMRVGGVPILEWWITAGVLFIGAWLVSPENAKVMVYKICLAAIGGVMGWALDRRLFPRAQPMHFEPDDKPNDLWRTAMIRQAIIIAAMIHGVTTAL